MPTYMVLTSTPCHTLPHLLLSGAAVVDAHGAALSATMLPLFEGYLEPQGRTGRDERRYDLVREGVVVLLGTLAGHMEQGDDKVCGWVGAVDGAVEEAAALLQLC